MTDTKREASLEGSTVQYVEKFFYDELTTAIKELRAKHDRVLQALEIAKKQLEGCRGAMAYAYEDRCDQYYLNVAENIIETIAQIEGLK